MPSGSESERAPRFRFACQRSGRCCTHGEGRVWLEEGEAERLARSLDLALDVFVQRFARRLNDPVRGDERLSLREERGRCVLLEGDRHCTVYADRPHQCRTFPAWPAIENDPAGFEAARAICPSIAVVVDEELLERASRELEELMAGYPEPGAACPFEDRGASLWASGLEVDWLLARSGPMDVVDVGPSGTEPGSCPFECEGRCQAGSRRPLACRLHGATPKQHEEALAALRALEAGLGYPRAYGPLAGLVHPRRAPIHRPASPEAAT